MWWWKMKMECPVCTSTMPLHTTWAPTRVTPRTTSERSREQPESQWKVSGTNLKSLSSAHYIITRKAEQWIVVEVWECVGCKHILKWPGFQNSLLLHNVISALLQVPLSGDKSVCGEQIATDFPATRGGSVNNIMGAQGPDMPPHLSVCLYILLLTGNTKTITTTTVPRETRPLPQKTHFLKVICDYFHRFTPHIDIYTLSSGINTMVLSGSIKQIVILSYKQSYIQSFTLDIVVCCQKIENLFTYTKGRSKVLEHPHFYSFYWNVSSPTPVNNLTWYKGKRQTARG